MCKGSEVVQYRRYTLVGTLNVEVSRINSIIYYNCARAFTRNLFNNYGTYILAYQINIIRIFD
jgi:hypothetical protein